MSSSKFIPGDLLIPLPSMLVISMFKKLTKRPKLKLDGAKEDTTNPVQKLPKKRQRGIQGTEPKVYQLEEELPSLSKNFVKPNSQPKEKPKSSPQREESELYTVPPQYKIDNSRIQDGHERTPWLSKLTEVPLSLEHKLDNIESTEAAMRSVFGEQPNTSRFSHLHSEHYETHKMNHDHARTAEKLENSIVKQFSLKKLRKEKQKKAYKNKLIEQLLRQK